MKTASSLKTSPLVPANRTRPVLSLLNVKGPLKVFPPVNVTFPVPVFVNVHVPLKVAEDRLVIVPALMFTLLNTPPVTVVLVLVIKRKPFPS